MMDDELKQIQRELDRFLQPLPERVRELFETVRYDAALKKLEAAEDPSPEWLQSQLRNLRVKARTIRAAVSEQAETLTTLLMKYTEAGGKDALRIAHAREALLFLQQTLDEQAAQAALLEQNAQAAAQLREQQELLDRLTLERFRKNKK
ncbi:MAG: hypothetical protein IIY94_08545 [Oscillospiraceae bacterium]|nr:hypothetical protein [Oscillospiraceae bacterium]